MHGLLAHSLSRTELHRSLSGSLTSSQYMNPSAAWIRPISSRRSRCFVGPAALLCTAESSKYALDSVDNLQFFTIESYTNIELSPLTLQQDGI
jgi:hypothetical protein